MCDIVTAKLFVKLKHMNRLKVWWWKFQVFYVSCDISLHRMNFDHKCEISFFSPWHRLSLVVDSWILLAILAVYSASHCFEPFMACLESLTKFHSIFIIEVMAHQVCKFFWRKNVKIDCSLSVVCRLLSHQPQTINWILLWLHQHNTYDMKFLNFKICHDRSVVLNLMH